MTGPSTCSSATRLRGCAQQVLARVQCGDLPLNSQGDTPFDEDPDYTYSVTVNQGTPDQSDVNGMWTVIIKVTRERPIGDPVEVTLTQLILDPTVIGSTQDVTPITGSDSSSSSGSGGSTGSSGATGDSGAGAAAAPAKAATPAKAAMPAKAAAPAASGAASGTKGTTSTPATGKSGSSGGKGP